MPSPRTRRVKKQIGGYVLQPAGLTNPRNTDATTVASLANLQNDGIYSADGAAPSFTEGSTTLLSDAVSNADGNWTLLGYAGETTANTSGFFKTGTVHRYLPYPGAGNTILTDTTPVVIYSKDGPQGKYNPSYLPVAGQVVNTGSLSWLAANISQSAGNQQKLMVYIAGAVPSASGDTSAAITFLTGSTFQSTLLAFSSSTNFAASASVSTASLGAGLRIVFSSSANTYLTNSFYNGVVIYVTGSN